MLFRGPHPEFDQEILGRVLEKLHAARLALRRALDDEDICSWEREKLESAQAALERAIAIAESYVE